MFKIVRLHIAAWILGVVAATGAMAQDASGFRLLMIEQEGCAFCRAFNRDVAPIYDISAEGAVAPLVHVDFTADLPEGVTLASKPYATPTFILLGPDGAEIDRLIGYPGDDFFWPFINSLLVQAGALPAAPN